MSRQKITVNGQKWNILTKELNSQGRHRLTITTPEVTLQEWRTAYKERDYNQSNIIIIITVLSFLQRYGKIPWNFHTSNLQIRSMKEMWSNVS